ncbi:hypothetical protein ScPMuIL_009778 [Solemya velum]
MCDVRHIARVDASVKMGSSRKITKPLMEKRRRARINDCLLQLKSMLLDAMKRDSAQFSKLEKADILEMTVAYLRNMQQQQMATAMVTDLSVGGKYRSGFTECASEVVRYLGSVQGINEDMKYRLENHITKCVHNVSSNCKENPSPQPMVQTQSICVQIPDRLSPVPAPLPETCFSTQLLVPTAFVGMTTQPEGMVYGQPQISSQNSLPQMNVLSESSRVNIRQSVKQEATSMHTSASENILPFPFAKPVQNQQVPVGSPVMKTDKMWRPW